MMSSKPISQKLAKVTKAGWGKILLFAFFASFCSNSAHAAFTEFYCNASTGSNVNAGSTTGAAAYTATNGGWNSGTGIFTPTSGNPSASVAVGDFASVYTDGATVTGFVGRVTAVNTTTITVSITAKSGTIPTTAGTGISCKVGGVWKGPNAAEAFPFAFVAATQTNASSDVPRVNLKNGTTYSITAAITHANSGPLWWEGYTTTPGDGGRATIDGGTSGTAYTLLSVSANANIVRSFVFQNNGASGNAHGISVGGRGVTIDNSVAHDLRGNGFNATSGSSIVWHECEAYLCNASNTAAQGGFSLTSGNGAGVAVRCFSHDHVGSNSHGFANNNNALLILVQSVAETNGGAGIRENGNNHVVIIGGDYYNNSGSGLEISGFAGTTFLIENANFLKNGINGIKDDGNGKSQGELFTSAFGSGTQVNTSGATAFAAGTAAVANSSVTYAANVTPWVDPANGDFRINLAAAKGTGRGAFTQTAASYAGTIAYPDIGAAQHLESPSGFPLSRTLP